MREGEESKVDFRFLVSHDNRMYARWCQQALASRLRRPYVHILFSSRKLRSSGTNLLPGRCLLHRLFPLTMTERPPETRPMSPGDAVVPLRWRQEPPDRFPAADLETRRELVANSPRRWLRRPENRRVT